MQQRQPPQAEACRPPQGWIFRGVSYAAFGGATTGENQPIPPLKGVRGMSLSWAGRRIARGDTPLQADACRPPQGGIFRGVSYAAFGGATTGENQPIPPLKGVRGNVPVVGGTADCNRDTPPQADACYPPQGGIFRGAHEGHTLPFVGCRC